MEPNRPANADLLVGGEVLVGEHEHGVLVEEALDLVPLVVGPARRAGRRSRRRRAWRRPARPPRRDRRSRSAGEVGHRSLVERDDPVVRSCAVCADVAARPGGVRGRIGEPSRQLVQAPAAVAVGVHEEPIAAWVGPRPMGVAPVVVRQRFEPLGGEVDPACPVSALR